MRKMIFLSAAVLWVASIWMLHVAISQGSAPGVAATPNEGLRVFVGGHSFQTYIWHPLWEMAQNAGLKDNGRWMPQYLGEPTTLQQWNLPADNNRAKELLMKGELDVMTMAPRTFPDAGIDNFVKLGLAHNPNMRFAVQVSWGAYDGDNQKPDNETATVDRNKTPDQLQALAEANIKAAEDQIEKLNKEIGKQVVFLVPTAQAVIALRTKIYNKEMPGLESQDQLFADAMGHPAPPLQTLNTYLHYAVIYGRSPVGLPVVGALKYAHNSQWDDKFNRSLQELAWETVTKCSFNGSPAAPEVKQTAALR